ncbi:MAG TPA: flagellar basal body rod protein FlgC [Deltaproteobacteria bacterium]|jgi:flagellar basal-body rod protein FlgC|nr:flagellar basal body rod protein FlgC [Deltaproteobacteria bacterium]HQI01812.1 flagellar basal body rod protein FlgC [Deltaproteobacteria bacterium]HQJ08383.1 flagellar basal body rod protein FlgC [Deltaproteobacteria bacterium]
MDLFTAMDISASGMRAQRTRMNVVSSNIANAHTTRSATGGPYQRRDVVFRENAFENKLSSVEVERIVSDPTPGQRVYEPGNPDADENGYVTLPNVNLMEEMVNMIGASQAFEANTTAVKAQKDMALKALAIGRI